MTRYRDDLPQLGGGLFLTDSGLETDLVFHAGFDLPHFAAFPLLEDEEGSAALEEYFSAHAELARDRGLGIVLETPTWRANADWGAKLGRNGSALREACEAAVHLLLEVRDRVPEVPVVVSGCVGPRGDGYRVDARMSAEQAQDYHASQVEVFAGTQADLVSALTLGYVEEAVGFVRAAAGAGLPAVVSFTVETDGRLPDGTALGEAVAAVDDATGAAAAYFMVNCAHPTHVGPVLADVPADRLRGLRANASSASHAELDEAEVLDEGDPQELGGQLVELHRRHPSLTVLGGCCGTDLRHIAALAAELRAGGP